MTQQMNDYCQLWLTCKDKAEAEKITNTLLVKRLVACVRQIPTNSTYWWQGKIEKNSEVILQMESRIDLFDKVEKEVAKIHSYDIFVLEAVLVKKISKKAEGWMADELSDNE